jgi:hypothetical protein
MKKRGPMFMGTVSSLAQWFQASKCVNGSEHDEIREEILSECYQFTEFGVSGETVILRTPRGRVCIDITNIGGTKVVEFDYVPNNQTVRTKFWMNHKSVADLGNRLRQAPEKRRPFDEIFFNGREK